MNYRDDQQYDLAEARAELAKLEAEGLGRSTYAARLRGYIIAIEQELQ